MNKKTNDTLIIIICFVLVAFIIGFFVFFAYLFATGVFDDSSNKSEPTADDIAENIVKMECRDRTNDYQKCSWSVFEDRCVCKLR